MVERITKRQRSYVMSRIRSKGTKPELAFKKALKGSRLRYQAKVFGKPDFSSKKKMVAIFIDGCFWHKCPKCYRPPQSNKGYWRPKIRRNVARAKKVEITLKGEGWRVVRFWEHEVMQNEERCLKKISALLKG